MDEKRYDVAAVKERLKTYSENQRDIDNQIERLERLITKMNGVGAQTISDMPRAKGVVGDRIADMVSQKDDLERVIREAIEEQSREWKRIEKILNQLRKVDERAVIRMRYHDGEGWSEVTKMLFGRKDDFEEKEETYLRRIHKIHGAALLNMARMSDGDRPPEFSTPP